jgi:molybdenum cofactor biosynthesis protein MoaC
MTDVELPPNPAPVGLAALEDRGGMREGGRSGAVRTAVAACRVHLGPETLAALREGRLSRPDAIPAARVAGALGARQTSRLLPFCHDVLLQDVEIEVEFDEAAAAVPLRAVVKSEGPAGVEMEAMTAVTVAALSIYDACKSSTREIAITDVRVLATTGGSGGDYRRGPS